MKPHTEVQLGSQGQCTCSSQSLGRLQLSLVWLQDVFDRLEEIEINIRQQIYGLIYVLVHVCFGAGLHRQQNNDTRLELVSGFFYAGGKYINLLQQTQSLESPCRSS